MVLGLAVLRERFSAFSQFGHFLIGLFLIVAFVATSTVLLFVISAEQLQASIATAEIGPTKTSIGAIRQDVAKIENYYTVLAAFSAKQVQTQEQLYQANIARQEALVRLVNTTAHIRSYINLLDSAGVIEPLKLHPFDEPQTGATERAQVFDQSVASYFVPYYTALDAMAASDRTAMARTALDRFKDNVYQRLTAYTADLAAFTAADSAVQALQAQAATLQKSKKEFDDTVGAAGTPLANENYWNLCENFYSFKTLVGEAAYKIVLLPKMMLILTLSIFMGVLGSLICISRDFLRNPGERTFWEILFRLGLGAGVAFALFFFAAAGMLAFGQEARTSGDSQLSPYLISFLGITAGYLSDRVADWMQEVGKRAFQLSDSSEPDRWGIGLEPETAAQNLSPGALAKALGETPDEVAGWLALTKPVPPGSQKALALYLHADRSRLFTDLEPAHG